MKCVTNDERYMPGVKMIEENRNLKQRVAELERDCEIFKGLWMNAIDTINEMEEQKRKDRELEEMVRRAQNALGVRTRSRDEIARDPYLRRIYGMEEQPRRAGGWRIVTSD